MYLSTKTAVCVTLFVLYGFIVRLSMNCDVNFVCICIAWPESCCKVNSDSGAVDTTLCYNATTDLNKMVS